MPYKDPKDPRRRLINQANYAANKDKIKARLAPQLVAHRENLRTVVREAKDVPCTDCGVRYPYYVMDFDHLGDKEHDIGRMVGEARKMSDVVAEIAKCEVVCSNCHRARTHARSQWPMV